jgi:predicted molibdopterin-dependent oxidoreductase YjgC
MTRLTIDNQPVEVPEGTTVLEAARSLGIEIPTLCHRDGHPPMTSCMVCLVKIDGRNRLLPSCATVVREGMVVESETEEVLAARRTALELLFSDHLGDCIAPCSVACPKHINIPLMLREIQAGRMEQAGAIGRLCIECGRCEKVCRRSFRDAAVSIRALACYVARFAEHAETPDEARVQGYSCHIGRPKDEEFDLYMVEANPRPRIAPGENGTFTEDQARLEAERCMHCDCRAIQNCRLRDAGRKAQARTSQYRGDRRPFEQQVHPGNVLYEPGKCIACGLCVQIAREAGEALGLTFIRRGFNVRVAVPFDGTLGDGLRRVAAKCIQACPTGALEFANGGEDASKCE